MEEWQSGTHQKGMLPMDEREREREGGRKPETAISQRLVEEVDAWALTTGARNPREITQRPAPEMKLESDGQRGSREKRPES